MKIKLFILIGIFFFNGCSKSSIEMFELADQKLKNKQPDLALLDLEKLLDKYPNDSLAANALYKMSTIHLHWNNNLSSGYNALMELVKRFPNSKQGIQAKIDIDEFPESVVNKTQSLRKKEMVKEAINNLMYLLDNHSEHNLMPKAQYMLGDIYMNDLNKPLLGGASDVDTSNPSVSKQVNTTSGNEKGKGEIERSVPRHSLSVCLSVP